MRNSFTDLSPSAMRKSCSTAVLKWSLRVHVKVTMHNGGKTWLTTADAIIIRRVDILKVHDYARAHACLRDYLMIRLPMKIGLRATEVCTLQIQDIQFDTRSFQVLDSKKKRFYPLPLDILTLQLIRDLVKLRKNGYVFQREGKKSWHKKHRGQPLARATVWDRVHKIGRAAGVHEFHPRLLRHYFAADWAYVQKKSIEGLRRILRHKNLFITHRYLARLVFFEDLQQEYEETQNPYTSPLTQTKPLLTDFYHHWCSTCEHEPICKIIDQMCTSPGATGCRFYAKKEEIKKVGI